MLKEMIELKMQSLRKESEKMYPYAKRSHSLSQKDMKQNKKKLDKMQKVRSINY